MAEVLIGKTSEEDAWTVDVTDGTQVGKWRRLTLQAGGTEERKSDQWVRFRIPANKLRSGLRATRTLTDVQREALRIRLKNARKQVFHTEITESDNEKMSGAISGKGGGANVLERLSRA